jgi:hypothetical protein
MRQAGRFMRDVQNTSHSFIAEMERAADTTELPPPAPAPEPVFPGVKTGPDKNEVSGNETEET